MQAPVIDPASDETLSQLFVKTLIYLLAFVIAGTAIYNMILVFIDGSGSGWDYANFVFSSLTMIPFVVMIVLINRKKEQLVIKYKIFKVIWTLVILLLSVSIIQFNFIQRHIFMVTITIISGSMMTIHLLFTCLRKTYLGTVPDITVQVASSHSSSLRSGQNIDVPTIQNIVINPDGTIKIETKRSPVPSVRCSQQDPSPHLLSPASARRSRSTTRRSRSSTSRSPSPTKLVPLASPKASTKPPVVSIYKNRSYHATGSQCSPRTSPSSYRRSPPSSYRRSSPSSYRRSPPSSYGRSPPSSTRSPSSLRKSPSRTKLELPSTQVTPTSLVPLASPEGSSEASPESEDEHIPSHVTGPVLRFSTPTPEPTRLVPLPSMDESFAPSVVDEYIPSHVTCPQSPVPLLGSMEESFASSVVSEVEGAPSHVTDSQSPAPILPGSKRKPKLLRGLWPRKK